jgi:hypothetical protein
MKILSIEEEVPRPSKLPNGRYTGTWGGNIIKIFWEGRAYSLTTEEGVRGIGFRVVVTIDGENMTFEELKN